MSMGTLESLFLFLSLILVLALVRFVTALPNEDLQAMQALEQRMKQFQEHRARNQLRWAALRKKAAMMASEVETTPPSLPMLDEGNEGDTEEVDCEAVMLAYMHLREIGELEE